MVMMTPFWTVNASAPKAMAEMTKKKEDLKV